MYSFSGIISINYDYDKADKVLKKRLLFKSQNNLEKSMKGSSFIFECVDLFYCRFTK